MVSGEDLYSKISCYSYETRWDRKEFINVYIDDLERKDVVFLIFRLKKERDDVYMVMLNYLKYDEVKRLFRYIGIKVREEYNRRYITGDDYDKFMLLLKLKGVRKWER